MLNILARPSSNQNEVLKSFFLVEMKNIEQSIKARKYFYIDDKDGKRRERLGDRRAEVNILVRTNVNGVIYDMIAPHMIVPGQTT